MPQTKVLVVDDSATDRAYLQDVLEKKNLTVITASSGKEAINTATLEKPDVIFLDILMADLDGYAVCRSLQELEETKEIPVIFVSSKKNRADIMWASEQGGSGYITKPYTPEDVHQELAKVI